MTEKSTVELEEGERELLYNALEVLSPDSTAMSDRLEVLTQYILDSTNEPGAVELDFEQDDLEIAISALDIVQPDDIDNEEMAVRMADMFREIYDVVSGQSPDLF